MKILLGLLFFGLCLFPLSLSAAMNGGDFEIYADTFSVVQDQLATGGAFTLYSTGGDPFATSTSGGAFSLNGGFLAAERSSVSLSIEPSSIALGQLSLAAVSSGSTVLHVTTEAPTGYTVTVSADGNLRKGNGGANDDLDNVLDGAVTAGSEEYGIVTSGGGGRLATDTALVNTLTIASDTVDVNDQQTTVTFKAAIGPHSRAGNYSQVVTFTLTANP